MQQLNKIILMNSATIPYQEFMLDGNIHFIGTQGVGKSTVLRAILFFYTADSRRLGISKEQKPFADYYFPYVNSYIVYEVARPDRTFCVWLQRRQNRLVFRFIDGAYNRDMFIDERKVVTEDAVIKKHLAKGVKVERQFSNKEFLDTIYGAKREMRRYSLLESSAYQNIPRTISNIFMNSSLDASFIKQTIIHSLTDDPHVINLDTNRHHLETAQKDYQDVLEYKKHEKKAQNIVRAYERLLAIEETMKALAWQTGASYNNSLQEMKNLEYQLNEKQHEIDNKKTEREKAESNARKEINSLNKSLGVEQENIKKANKLKKEYEEHNIGKILAENQKKPQYQSERDQKAQMLNNLTLKHQDAEQSFEYAIKDVENKLSRDKEYFQQEVADEKERFYERKAELYESYTNYLQNFDDEYGGQIGQVREQINNINLEIRDLDNRLKNIHEKLYFAEERQKLDEEIGQKQKDEAVKREQSGQKEQQIKSIRKDWENSLEKIENQYHSKINEASEKIKHLRQQKADLEQKLKKYSATLIEFLDRQKPDWRDDIGKIIHEDLLLRTDLYPDKGQGNDLFGIKLNLQQLSSTQLSRSYLEDELNSVKSELEKWNKSLQSLQQELEDEKTKIKKKYNKKVKDLQDSHKQNQHDLEQLGIRLEHLKNERAKLFEKAEEQRKADTKQAKDERAAKEQKLKELLDSENEYRQALKEKKDSLRREQKKKIDDLKKKRDASIAKSRQEIKRLEKQADNEKESLNQQRHKALKEKGVDTDTLSKLEQQRDELDEKLEWLAEKSTLIAHYQKDYKEYIAKIDEFQQNRKFLDEKIKRRQENLDKRLKIFDREIDRLQKELNNLHNSQKHHKGQIEYMETEFRLHGLYTDYKGFIENSDIYSEDMVRNLAGKLLEEDRKKAGEQNSLLEKVSQFTGNFSEDNILQFPVRIQTSAESMGFADDLKKFINNQQILDFEKEVNQKYAMVLENIGKETDALLENEEHVHSVIRKINQDFKNSNFVGVVRSIEMRIKESDNPLVQVLKAIREFRENNPYIYGKPNLFSGEDKEKQDREAVKLLEELYNRMNQQKERKIRLENAFELEFRIRENENDTDWVNRLANVGSNGTDVLVKSMIYINLLNIFKKKETRKTDDSKLHCLIDEVGVLHDTNVKGLIDFATARNINLVNGSPNSHNEEDYKHIYQFQKDPETNNTHVVKLLSHFN